jgi:hypothetical protein
MVPWKTKEMSLAHSMHSSPTFQDVFNGALVEFTNQTGRDLATFPLTSELENCKSVDDVLLVLREQAKAFREFREGNKKLMKILEPTVNVIYSLSLAFSGVIGLVRRLRLV